MRRREGDEAGIVQMQLLPTLGKALCYEILAAYFANYPLQPLKQDRKDKIFHNFLFALHQHFRTHRDVAYYAGLQCLTPRYFTTIVRRTSGATARRSPIRWDSPTSRFSAVISNSTRGFRLRSSAPRAMPGSGRAAAKKKERGRLRVRQTPSSGLQAL